MTTIAEMKITDRVEVYMNGRGYRLEDDVRVEGLEVVDRRERIGYTRWRARVAGYRATIVRVAAEGTPITRIHLYS